MGRGRGRGIWTDNKNKFTSHNNTTLDKNERRSASSSEDIDLQAICVGADIYKQCLVGNVINVHN